MISVKINYKPKTSLEKFGDKICNLLVDNFPQTFYVGGMVRDMLLKKTITDIDIATKARPEQVIKILRENNISLDASHKQFGVVIAKNAEYNIEITTFRKDSYGNNRYPNISFAATPKQDSQRRDFTINALYLSPKSLKILDFHRGLKDLELRHLKFIGNPARKILEDPLRIARALRFRLTLHFKFNFAADQALEKKFHLLSKITASRLNTEINKIKNPLRKNVFKKIIRNKKIA